MKSVIWTTFVVVKQGVEFLRIGRCHSEAPHQSAHSPIYGRGRLVLSTLDSRGHPFYVHSLVHLMICQHSGQAFSASLETIAQLQTMHNMAACSVYKKGIRSLDSANVPD